MRKEKLNVNDELRSNFNVVHSQSIYREKKFFLIIYLLVRLLIRDRLSHKMR